MAIAEKIPEQTNGRDGSAILSLRDTEAPESSTVPVGPPSAPVTSEAADAPSKLDIPATPMTAAPLPTSEATVAARVSPIAAPLANSNAATPSPPGAPGPAAVADMETNVRISNLYFMRDLRRLRELRSFLIQEAVNISGSDLAALEFGILNQLRYSDRGREPNKEEWTQVEHLTQSLFRLLTDPLRRRFLLGEIPMWISWGTAALVLLAVATLVTAVIVQSSRKDINAIATTMPFYLVWLVSLGAIGSVAFIGMNALSVQQDVTFDLSNRRLLMLRIILGALFGLVLTLPFGYDAFKDFISAVVGNTPTIPSGSGAKAGSISTPAMLLLLPFVFGFSTSVVIMVLNRFVDGLQAFFGKVTNADARASPSSGAQTK